MKKHYIKNKYRYTALLITLAVLIASFVYNSLPDGGTQLGSRAEGALRVHYIDVGQGDSALIELPNNEVMLIDAGENDKGGTVARYIKSCGISRIDYLIGTHPHSDHIGGLETVINEFDIGKLYMPKVEANTVTFSDVLDAAEAKGLQINSARAGVKLVGAGDLNVDMLAPVRESYKSKNDYSAVVKVEYRNASFLFTGDAEKTSEREITADVKADVLKVGHHGSETSSSQDFLDRVNPEFAVISCGRDNDYGHPHKEVLSRFEERNTAVYRTDKDGTVVFETLGDGYDIYTENEEE